MGPLGYGRVVPECVERFLLPCATTIICLYNAPDSCSHICLLVLRVQTGGRIPANASVMLVSTGVGQNCERSWFFLDETPI